MCIQLFRRCEGMRSICIRLRKKIQINKLPTLCRKLNQPKSNRKLILDDVCEVIKGIHEGPIGYV